MIKDMQQYNEEAVLTWKDFCKVSGSLLIMHSDEFSRKTLASILEDKYKVFQAGDTDEAIRIINHEDIAVIITDLEMYISKGRELEEYVNKEAQSESIPVIIAEEGCSEENAAACLKLGAADFIRKPYNPEIVRNRIEKLVRSKNMTKMLSALGRDSLTGLYTSNFFYQRVREILNENKSKKYCIVVSNIEKFKILNERYGVKKCDEVLVYIAKKIPTLLEGYVIGGRIHGDVFAYLQEETSVAGFRAVHEMQYEAPIPNLSIKYGIYRIDDNTRNDISIMIMCDRAREAVNSIKGIYGKYYSEYDDKLREAVLVQQLILENMEHSLKAHQFDIYYQPKHNISSDKTAGAEALVRWNHPEIGFLAPNIFIPIFEKNGFIKKLDRYVFKKVCSDILEWKKSGKNVVPVSVNMSRRDFEDVSLADYITEYVDLKGIDHELIHFEITETMFTDNDAQIIEMLKKLHENGFIIELDDFGTGYSSISSLNDIELDVLKFDMSLVQHDDMTESGRSLLEFIVELANLLKLQTVAEGVETKDQAEHMKTLGVDYIQGYYYSKPLPKNEFETYIHNV
jgi:diguanylate cyclase (GGDEF)-like protein